MKLYDWIVVLLIVASIFFVMGSTIGTTIGTNNMSNEAIEHKCAYYHPDTGAFTWLLNKDDKIKP